MLFDSYKGCVSFFGLFWSILNIYKYIHIFVCEWCFVMGKCEAYNSILYRLISSQMRKSYNYYYSTKGICHQQSRSIQNELNLYKEIIH